MAKTKKFNFNDFRFGDLNYTAKSNKYLTMKRVSEDEKKIVVKISDAHILKTKFGYALILDKSHVVFLKEWQVNSNWFGTEVLINKDYWNVKEWGDFSDKFMEEKENLNFENWLETAKKQEASGTIVSWEK